MPIRIAVQINTRPLDGLQSMLKNVQKVNEAIVAQVAAKHEGDYLAPMRDLDPGPSQHGAKRGAWSTNPEADARARRWWWWAVHTRKVPSDPITGAYIRTGQLNRQWRFVARKDRFVLENSSPIAAYVFSFAQNIRARGGKPNPGHIRTGHPLEAQVIATGILARLRTDVAAAYSQTVAASVAAGEYTIVVP